MTLFFSAGASNLPLTPLKSLVSKNKQNKDIFILTAKALL